MSCEKNYSMWTFSGGFRTWVKMSIVKTYGKRDETVEFHQEVFFLFLCPARLHLLFEYLTLLDVQLSTNIEVNHTVNLLCWLI